MTRSLASVPIAENMSAYFTICAEAIFDCGRTPACAIFLCLQKYSLTVKRRAGVTEEQPRGKKRDHRARPED